MRGSHSCKDKNTGLSLVKGGAGVLRASEKWQKRWQKKIKRAILGGFLSSPLDKSKTVAILSHIGLTSNFHTIAVEIEVDA